MNKQSSILVGLLILVLCFAGVWFALQFTKPDPTEVDIQSAHIKPANAALLGQNSMKNIENRVIYGNIPVVSEENYNNEDIFN